MRPSRFTEEQIIGLLKEQETGAALGNMAPVEFAMKSTLEKQAA
ncbi:Uncharacterised protein [Starkeya nomas]|uniref:Transposase n=1 Tax=Starkeya nomas TaxID=2666134 RepID=A0A5S9PZ25_9HYPH|nr:hypothetical protein [Starkeya nomas]CAA0110447.1 Uncharacterised protein [Starkeya nomas]